MALQRILFDYSRNHHEIFAMLDTTSKNRVVAKRFAIRAVRRFYQMDYYLTYSR